jgi:signal peptidase II
LIFFLAIIIVVLDQVAKYVVTEQSAHLPVDLIKGVFSINIVHNRGGAFGILRDYKLIFIVIPVIAIAIIIFYLRKNTKTGFFLGMILGGAIGNLIDRIRFGYVIDFLDFKIWPVFNIADAAITIGIFLLIINYVKNELTERKRKL